MTPEPTWAEKLDVPRAIDAKPVPEGRRDPRARQLTLYPIGRVVDTVIRATSKTPTLNKVSLDRAFILARRTHDAR